MRKTKLSILFLTGAFCIGISGCGNSAESNTQEPPSVLQDEETQSDESENSDDTLLEQEDITDNVSAEDEEMETEEIEDEEQIEEDTSAEENESTVSNADIAVGDSFIFGKYEQDDDMDNGNEDIEWTVLDIRDESALIYSNKILDVSYFQGDKIDSDSFCWGTSDLHNWLNTEFYSTAFDSEEQNQIRPMHIVKGDISTDDNVFILSKLEMENYISSKEDRIVSPTRYAYNLGLEVDPSQKSEFWLRTVADLDESYVYKKIDTVAADGQLAYEDVAYKLCGVRPALWITLNNSNISEPIECPFDEPEDYVAPSAYVTERTSLEIGENVFFGTFPYSFNGKSLPKGEDIPWRVSEQNGDEYLLTSNYGFSPDQDELENVFYFDAFNKTEQHMIVTQTDSDGNAYDLKFSSSGTSIEVWVKLN